MQASGRTSGEENVLLFQHQRTERISRRVVSVINDRCVYEFGWSEAQTPAKTSSKRSLIGILLRNHYASSPITNQSHLFSPCKKIISHVFVASANRGHRDQMDRSIRWSEYTFQCCSPPPCSFSRSLIWVSSSSRYCLCVWSFSLSFRRLGTELVSQMNGRMRDI